MENSINKENDIELQYEIMKSEYAGFEYEKETEENIEDSEKPFNADKIRIDQQMLSVKYIMELMDGELIELNPGFQRYRVWKEVKRKSLLIESLMLRIPIPAFYFYENEDGKFQVIDGQQRLRTIKDFIDDDFRLSGLEYLGKEYDKKLFSELDLKYQQRIYRTQLAVNTLDARSPKKVVYDIFRRVNTGGVSLNPQEMRNAICKPETREFLRKGTKNENYLKATRNKVKDDRMDSQELVLRFFAFYFAYDYKTEKLTYNFSGISDMLDEAIEKINNMTNIERNNCFNEFDKAMKRCVQAFGKYSFSKLQLDDGVVGRKLDYINKSLFSSFSILLLSPKYDEINLQLYQNGLLKALAKALENHTYVSSITVGTGDKRNVYLNYKLSKEVLNECLKEG